MWWASWNNCFNGDEFAKRKDDSLAPSLEFERVLRVRLLVGDPEARLIGYCEALPEDGKGGLVYTTGDGSYYRFVEKVADGEGFATIWEEIETAFHDAEIEGYQGSVCDIAKKIITREMAQGSSSGLLQSFTAGGQSTSFASVADVQAHFKGRLRMIDDICGGGVPRIVGTRSPVGYSCE